MAEINFGKLYDYNTPGGTVVEQTSTIRRTVEDAFRAIFGPDFSVAEETIGGRLIEAITLLFKDVLGVNAQNAGMVNPNVASGAYLEHIGALFGVSRDADESDFAYRERILASVSRGSGFAQSIRNALGKVGATDIAVIENGLEDPAILPLDEYGVPVPHSIVIPPHSVFISCSGANEDGGSPSDTEIARAILTTKSAGCAYVRDTLFGTPKTVVVGDGAYATGVTFYNPTPMTLDLEISVIDDAYLGTDVIGDTEAAIRSYFADHTTNCTVERNDIVAAVAAAGKNIVVKSVGFVYGGASVERVIVRPYQKVTVGNVVIAAI